MGKKKRDPMKGIYLRHDMYWVRYSVNGVQYRVNLKTRDAKTAIDEAARVRGTVPTDGKPIAWDNAVEEYLHRKVAAGDFEEWTVSRTRSALKQFQIWSAVRSPHQVTKDLVQAYYRYLAKEKSEATARTYAARAAIFLGDLHGAAWKLDYNSGNEVPMRDVVVSCPEIWDLIYGGNRPDVQFVLMCGFLAGMRVKEIVQARPTWIRLGEGVISIPAQEKQRTSAGTRLFKTKSGRARKIPLHAALRQWCEQHLKPDALFCIHPEQASKPYRWNPHLPFRKHLAAMEVKNVSFHTMRHTFISHLANSGRFSPFQVSAWSGDRIETIQKNYFHAAAPAGALDEAFDSEGKAVDWDAYHTDGRDLDALLAEASEHAGENAAQLSDVISG